MCLSQCPECIHRVSVSVLNKNNFNSKSVLFKQSINTSNIYIHISSRSICFIHINSYQTSSEPTVTLQLLPSHTVVCVCLRRQNDLQRKEELLSKNSFITKNKKGPTSFLFVTEVTLEKLFAPQILKVSSSKRNQIKMH